MARARSFGGPSSFCFCFFFFFFFFFMEEAFCQSYIVYMGCQHQSPIGVEQSLVEIHNTHHQMLQTIVGSKEEADSSLLYSYKHCFNGFAAKLRPEQAHAMSEMAGVVSVFPNKAHQIQTTRSWEFLGLEDALGNVSKHSLWTKSGYGRDVIIGVIDTGVWPESVSYNDEGIGPIPARWKGVCENGQNFSAANCNRKLIGARYYLKGYEAVNGPLNMTETGDFRSPRDKEGHGTHTSSTAGGRVASGASTFGFAVGSAKGGAPLSRLAIYKACWTKGCFDADVLAAFDAGIGDGVDLFSISLGTSAPLPKYFADSIAIGSFHAMERGVPVVCSAGNDGPTPGSVTNVAPWILTVAATSIDRTFPSNVVLGNGITLNGGSLSKQKLTNTSYPLVSAIQVKKMEANNSASERCFPDTLDPDKTKGKIVVCLRGVTARIEKGEVVLEAGGAGMILSNSMAEGDEILSDPHLLPATHVTAQDGVSLLTYINTTTRSPTAYITPPYTQLDTKPAPVMASFSSQGPNSLTPDILKPDISAPGLNILAAWTEASGPSSSTKDLRRVKFNVISGTSMSCPHVAGIVALLKALHPDWSPAAIKSAIMTTASLVGNTGEAILNGSNKMANPMNYGAGHVNPSVAANPGLVYDMGYSDYVLFFLCNLNYNQSSLNMITGRNDTCPTASNRANLLDLNYPSIAVSNLVGEGKNQTSITIRRILTNVDENGGVYKVVVKHPPRVHVKVSPKRLIFGSKGEKKSFKVTLMARRGAQKGKYVFGHFTWKDGKKHHVRTPIAVRPM